jgi:hypothetical protein
VSTRINPAFDAKKAGYRKAGALRHALKPSDLVMDFSEGPVVTLKLSDSGDLFNEFEHARGF